MEHTSTKVSAEHCQHKGKVVMRCGSSRDCNFEVMYEPPTYFQNDS
jgi:hypothetical protein